MIETQGVNSVVVGTDPDRFDITGWSSLHDLMLVYLAMVHGADARIDAAEQQMMSDKLAAWFPDSFPLDVDDLYKQVMLVYMGESGRQMLDASVASLKEVLAEGQRIAVLNDLADIATADGMLVRGEISYIQILAHLWDVETETRH